MAALENVPGRESSGRWLSRAALFGAGMLEAWAAPKVIGALTRWSGPKDLFDAGVEAIDRRRRWRELPVPLGAVSLIGPRDRLRTDKRACKAVGFITPPMRLPCRRLQGGSRHSDDGRRPREYRSAPLFARRGRAAPLPCSSASAASCSCVSQ